MFIKKYSSEKMVIGHVNKKCSSDKMVIGHVNKKYSSDKMVIDHVNKKSDPQLFYSVYNICFRNFQISHTTNNTIK